MTRLFQGSALNSLLKKYVRDWQRRASHMVAVGWQMRSLNVNTNTVIENTLEWLLEEMSEKLFSD